MAARPPVLWHHSDARQRQKGALHFQNETVIPHLDAVGFKPFDEFFVRGIPVVAVVGGNHLAVRPEGAHLSQAPDHGQALVHIEVAVVRGVDKPFRAFNHQKVDIEPL